MEQVETIRRQYHCNSATGSRKRHSDGSFHLFYYCRVKDCPYALCAIHRPATGDGEGSLIRLYARGAHTHPVDRPIRATNRDALSNDGDESDDEEEDEMSVWLARGGF
jgi:hypothetical protein